MIAIKEYKEQIDLLYNSPPCFWMDQSREIIWALSRAGSFPQPINLGGWGHTVFLGNIAENTRLETVNHYFKFKAGQVLGNKCALKLLADLNENKVLTMDEWEKFISTNNTIALAMLSSAGFCEVSEHAIAITEAGKKFISDVLETR